MKDLLLELLNLGTEDATFEGKLFVVRRQRENPCPQVLILVEQILIIEALEFLLQGWLSVKEPSHKHILLLELLILGP